MTQNSSLIPQNPPCYHLIMTSNSPTSDLANHWLVLHNCNFAFGECHKWNHKVYNLLRLASCTQHNTTEIYPSFDTYHRLLLCVCWYTVHGCTTVCLLIYWLREICIVSSFWWLLIELIQIFVYRFLYELVFISLGEIARRNAVF